MIPMKARQNIDYTLFTHYFTHTVNSQCTQKPEKRNSTTDYVPKMTICA